MNATFVTSKANAALQAIAEGRQFEVTRQMIDRLSKDGLIDFAVSRDGWFLTDKGWLTISYKN